MRLKPKVRQILQSEFERVPGLRALYVDVKRGHLFAQVKLGMEQEMLTTIAFDAFTRAADRVATEAGNDPLLTWYGLRESSVPDATEILL